jgi:non-haem Fe2+, alpha-ketoglutarate-dependent halogenase
MDRKLFFQENGYWPKIKVTESAKYTGAFNDMLDKYGHGRDDVAPAIKRKEVAFIEELKSNSNITSVVKELIGPFEVYSVSVFNKYPGTAYVGWHQDAPYWRGWKKNPKEVVSAWYAVDDSFLENGCLKIIPGTHKSVIKHAISTDEGNMLPQNLVIPGVDINKAVPLILKSGEASFHHGLIVHGSDANTSNVRRAGIAIRYISTSWVDKLRLFKKGALSFLK